MHIDVNMFRLQFKVNNFHCKCEDNSCLWGRTKVAREYHKFADFVFSCKRNLWPDKCEIWVNVQKWNNFSLLSTNIHRYGGSNAVLPIKLKENGRQTKEGDRERATSCVYVSRKSQKHIVVSESDRYNWNICKPTFGIVQFAFTALFGI